MKLNFDYNLLSVHFYFTKMSEDSNSRERVPLRKLRTERYKAMLRADLEEKHRTGNRDYFGAKNREFVNTLSAILITKSLILGPLERLKIVMQVSPIAKYANPTSDTPKNLTDLV